MYAPCTQIWVISVSVPTTIYLQGIANNTDYPMGLVVEAFCDKIKAA